jgi:DNA-binding SARP family transcriptional activator
MLQKNYEASIDYCQKILARDPCHEDAYRGLMRCYSRLGQRNRAIAWYNICKKTIERELDLSPEPATVEIYNKISKDEYV